MTTQDELDRFHSFELSGWRRLASGYARYYEPLVSQAITPLLAAVAPVEGARILDLCCGPGYVSAEIKRRGGVPTGVDFAAEMIALGKARWPDIDFQQGDAEALQFYDQAFDAVVANFGFLHLARPEIAMGQIARVLKPGGRVAFTVWASPAESIGHRIMLQAVTAHGKTDVGLPEGPALFRFSDKQECQSLFASAGLAGGKVVNVAHNWSVPAPDGLFDAVISGGVRIATLLEAQSPEALARIRTAVREACAPYRRDGALQIPLASVLASAVRP